MPITYRIGGLSELLKAEQTMGAKTEGILTDHLMTLGEDVALDVRERYFPISVEGAYGVQPKVFASGLWVVQTIEKSKYPERRRPNFGPMMWREAFAPAVADNQDRIGLAAELAVEEAARLYWDRI